VRSCSVSASAHWVVASRSPRLTRGAGLVYSISVRRSGSIATRAVMAFVHRCVIARAVVAFVHRCVIARAVMAFVHLLDHT